MRIRKLTRNNSGQALIETALILPLLLTIVLNAVNFAFFFLMALNITASSRSGAIYSVMGGATPSALALPKKGPVGTLASQDLTGAVFSPSTMAGVQVCSSTVGIQNPGKTNMETQCATGFGSVGTFGSTVAEPDPEMNAGNTAPAFLLNRVVVAYQFRPPIPIMPLNILVLAAPVCTSSGGTVTCTFYRQVEMREMQ